MRLRALGVALAGGAFILTAHALVCVAFGLRGAAALDVFVFAAAAGASALATGLLLGARFGEAAWTDPRAMLGPGGRMVSAGTLLAQAAVWLLLAHSLPLAPVAPLPGVLLLAAGVAFSAGALALAARVVERREYMPD